jgi:hypothetical protein
MLFKEILAIYYENNKKSINTLCGQNVESLTIKASDACSYHWALNG